MTEERLPKQEFPYREVSNRIEQLVLRFPEVEGIASDGMQDLMAGLSHTIRKRGPRGILIRQGKDGLQIDISLSMAYGFPVNEVCQRIQQAVFQELQGFVSDQVRAVNINVTKIIVRKGVL